MGKNLEQTVKDICNACGNDRTRMMDIVRATQQQFGCVPSWAMNLIAEQTGTHRIEVASAVTFYSFLSEQPKGKIVIRLADDVVSRMNGSGQVAEALAAALGIDFGATTPDGAFTLEHTACIGMSDQCPAALVNDVVVTNLTPESARQMVAELKQHMDPAKLVHRVGDGNNAHERVRAMVVNNIRRRGEVIFGELPCGSALAKALAMTPAEVIRDVSTARLRGRGGAGFPTGMKWQFARAAVGDKRFVICNADEGEPGTFKDRVLLTERADMLFEGMTIAGYAIGAEVGILYLRAEYCYLRGWLESVLAERRKQGLLGRNICGRNCCNFDIRIQMGAGAYICGEETALISSCEGQRGDPKTRPPFPAQKGYLDCPTVVNNVETLCAAAQILDKGPGWFGQVGTANSTGTKLLSVSGDCAAPGVYEVPLGTRLTDLLKLAGADNAAAVQVGGPSGQMVDPSSFGKKIDFDELATGGSIIVFGPGRDLLEVVSGFLDFFSEEGCGYCTPCRVGNVLLKERVDQILSGHGEPGDLEYLQGLGQTVKLASRCGLGQTSPNPVLTTLKNFRKLYESKVRKGEHGLLRSFDLAASLAIAEKIAGRKAIFEEA